MPKRSFDEVLPTCEYSGIAIATELSIVRYVYSTHDNSARQASQSNLLIVGGLYATLHTRA